MIGLILPLVGSLLSPLTLPEAISRARTHDAGLADFTAQAAGAEAQTDATRANYLPKLKVDANVMLWDKEQTIAFSPLAPPTKLRDQVTTQATVQVIEPLVGLYSISKGVALSEANTGVTRIQRQNRERQLAMDTVRAYYRTLQAQAIARAAAQQVESLAAQEKRVLSLEQNGVLGKNDVLRLQVALAAARQRSMEAQAHVEQGQAGLAILCGASPNETFELDPTPPTWADEALPGLDAARDQALRDRPELAEAQARQDQAETAVDLARAKMLPDVNAIAQYQRTDGNKFAEKNALFAGLFLTWIPWEWGATAKQIDVAGAQVNRAAAFEQGMRNAISMDVMAAHVDVRTAESQIAVAEGAVSQAEEALRLEKALMDAQKATTTDVIDAETALLQARVNLENARTQRLIARAGLRAATGLPIAGEAGEKNR